MYFPRRETTVPLLFNSATCQAHTLKVPYRLVLCDNVLEDRDLVEADWVSLVIKDHKTSVRCADVYVLRRKK